MRDYSYTNVHGATITSVIHFWTQFKCILLHFFIVTHTHKVPPADKPSLLTFYMGENCIHPHLYTLAYTHFCKEEGSHIVLPQPLTCARANKGGKKGEHKEKGGVGTSTRARVALTEGEGWRRDGYRLCCRVGRAVLPREVRGPSRRRVECVGRGADYLRRGSLALGSNLGWGTKERRTRSAEGWNREGARTLDGTASLRVLYNDLGCLFR